MTTLIELLFPFRTKYYTCLDANDAPTTGAVVKGHPLYAHKVLVNVQQPRYFEVETEPSPPIFSVGKELFTARKVRYIREVGRGSPEFALDLLGKMALDGEYVLRLAAARMLDSTAREFLISIIEDTLVCKKRFSPSDFLWNLRRIAVGKLDPEKDAELLMDRLENDDDEISAAAIERLDATHNEPLFQQISMEKDPRWARRLAAIAKLDAKNNYDLLQKISEGTEFFYGSLFVRKAAKNKLASLQPAAVLQAATG